MKFKDATTQEIETALQGAWEAFQVYRKTELSSRADLMRDIAKEIESLGDPLIQTAMEETNLPEARLRNERARTMFQLSSYAEACEKGDWMDIRIDTAIPDRVPPKPDIRKMNIPLGPVVVFGSSNFPFAYSTAGGDTATALAAGCPVIVKAHPAHPRTSEMVAGAIGKAIRNCHLPEQVFTHLHGTSFEVGQQLVLHPLTKAIGFTGSFSGGKALYDLACKRPEPIPVFAEMGSINPVFLLPGKLSRDHSSLAQLFAASITLGAGQFCTNPGILIGLEGVGLDSFIQELGEAIQKINPSPMLHTGIANAYREKKEKATSQKNVNIVAQSPSGLNEIEGQPAIATTDGQTFLQNPLLHLEVFGPYSLVVRCSDFNEMLEVASHLEGQLTCSIMGDEDEMSGSAALIERVKNICGRLIFNSVPTGVEVCASMHHGGPYPATTDARFTSVGEDGIRRFVRPLAWQNWPQLLLPDELKDENTLLLRRMVNSHYTTAKIKG